MTTNLTLEHVRQAKKMTNELSRLAGDIVHDNIQEDYHYKSPVYQRIYILNEQIAALRVYMDDIEGRLEWREFVCSQLRFIGTTLIGAVIGIVLAHAYFLGH